MPAESRVNYIHCIIAWTHQIVLQIKKGVGPLRCIDQDNEAQEKLKAAPTMGLFRKRGEANRLPANTYFSLMYLIFLHSSILA